MTHAIYLDHHATTPLDQRVLEAMMPYLTVEFGNPSSRTHGYGQRARDAVESARAQVAALLGARPAGIVFTAGATEANNLAVKGAARAAGRGTHLVGTRLEHESTAWSLRDLEREGFTVSWVAPGPDGIVPPAAAAAAIRPGTVLVSVIAANGEIGTVQPLEAIGAAVRAAGALFHSDLTQAAGRIPVDVEACALDLGALSAHKFHGPKGVGALYLREGIPIEPLLSGGGQERGLRSGTLNVPGIVGMGAAAEIRAAEMQTEAAAVAALRDRLWEGLRRAVPGARLNGDPVRRLPGNLNVSFPGLRGEALLRELPGFALSTGSACRSGTDEPSEVLAAIGVGRDLAPGTVRFGLGRSTTAGEVDRLIAAVERAAHRLRSGGREPERAPKADPGGV